MVTTNKATEPEETEKAQAEAKAAPEESTVPTGRVRKTVAADAQASEEAGAEAQRQVKSAIDKEIAQGFRGVPADPTPNENYTLAGVTDPNKHVPEEFKIQTGAVVLPDVHPDAKK